MLATCEGRQRITSGMRKNYSRAAQRSSPEPKHIRMQPFYANSLYLLASARYLFRTECFMPRQPDVVTTLAKPMLLMIGTERLPNCPSIVKKGVIGGRARA